MALSDELLGFTSPILDRAVKTGGWGTTTKKNDPSVVSDALFKKAQLDLGIANLQMDAGMHEMDSRMNVAMHALDNNITLQDMLNKERQNHVGFFEALVTDLAGAAEGAVTGFAVGGPVGAVVGGAAGFGLTAASQAESGRRGGQGAMSALGTIAGAATTIKGFSDQAKSKDSWTSILQTAGGIVGKMNSGDSAQRQEGNAEWAQLLNNAAQGQIQAGVNPQTAFEGVRKFSDAMMSGQPEGMDAMQAYNEFAGIQNPGRDDFKNFWDQSNKAGTEESPYHLVDPEAVNGLGDSMGYGSAKGTRMRPATPENGPVNNPTQSPLPMEQPRFQRNAPQSKPLEIERLDSNGNPTGQMITPTQGRSINQPAPSQTSSVQGRSGGAANFPLPQINRPGLQIEALPAQAEQNLSRQGAETVKALNLNDQGGQAQGQTREQKLQEMEKLKKPMGFWDRGSQGMPWETDNASHNRKIDQAEKSMTEHDQAMSQAPDELALDQKLTEIRQGNMEEERAARNPGVKESRQQAYQELDSVRDQIKDLPTKDQPQRNTKRGLRMAVEASEQLNDVMDKVPDSLSLRMARFVKDKGIGIKSPHVSADILDEIADVGADSAYEKEFTPQERDIIQKFHKHKYDLAYADAAIDAGRDVSSEKIRESMKQMPDYGDNYRTRSKKLEELMKGYKEDIVGEGAGSTGHQQEVMARQKDQLDLQIKRGTLQNQQMERQQKQAKIEEANSDENKFAHWLKIQKQMGRNFSTKRRK